MARQTRLRNIAVLVVALVLPAIAVAQTPPRGTLPPTPNAAQTDSKACGQGHATVGKGGGLDVQRQPGATLSDKLAQSNGVICPPPGIDPEIHEPAPPGGAMPVIPPPGSPGGNPNVQPK